MDIKHRHFQEIGSTQTYLRSNLEYDLVSTDSQTNGHGRGTNVWDSFNNSIAFSFKISPSNTTTLSSLEMGVLICMFCNKAELKLKWPNDLLTSSGAKAGGILMQIIDQQTIVVGIGLNWGSSKQANEYLTKKGTIYQTDLEESEYRELPRRIYDYILANRLSDLEIIKEWNKLCIHLECPVTIVDDTKAFGIFKKIGPFGEAHLDIDSKIVKFFAGSLIIN